MVELEQRRGGHRPLAELDVLLLTDESPQRFGQRLADHEPSLDAVINGWIRRPESDRRSEMIELSMDVSGGSAHVRDDALVVTVTLRNHSDRTMYAYEEARKIQYDAATKRLRLLFHDHEADPIVEQHLLRPHIKEIPAGEEADVQVRLPHEMRRLRSAEELAGLAAVRQTPRCTTCNAWLTPTTSTSRWRSPTRRSTRPSARTRWEPNCDSLPL